MNDRPELNWGEIASILGIYYTEDGYEHEEVVEAFDAWCREQKEVAHLEAMEGVIDALRTREDFLEATGADKKSFIRGFRAARLWAQGHREALNSLYETGNYEL